MDVPTRRQPLDDYLRPGLRVLLVGINPGLRSAAVGHHFAGYSNRFWRLLHESGLTPVRLRPEDDVRMLEWELGITNLVARATAGISDLRPSDYEAGLRILRRKVRRARPRIVAFVGVSLFRFVSGEKGRIALGAQDARFEGAEVFVLPNPSGRNANFTYREMLAAFASLASLASLASTRVTPSGGWAGRRSSLTRR